MKKRINKALLILLIFSIVCNFFLIYKNYKIKSEFNELIYEIEDVSYISSFISQDRSRHIIAYNNSIELLTELIPYVDNIENYSEKEYYSYVKNDRISYEEMKPLNMYGKFNDLFFDSYIYYGDNKGDILSGVYYKYYAVSQFNWDMEISICWIENISEELYEYNEENDFYVTERKYTRIKGNIYIMYLFRTYV